MATKRATGQQFGHSALGQAHSVHCLDSARAEMAAMGIPKCERAQAGEGTPRGYEVAHSKSIIAQRTGIEMGVPQSRDSILF